MVLAKEPKDTKKHWNTKVLRYEYKILANFAHHFGLIM